MKTNDGDNVGTPPLAVLIMGPAGCGKTKVGRLLAREIGAAFVDADDHHPQANLRKMAEGEALCDADRMPWLRDLAAVIHDTSRKGPLVLACSALKNDYRSLLEHGSAPTRTFFLDVPESVLAERLADRSDHFFNPELLKSQLETLETPPRHCHVNGDRAVDDICHELVQRLSHQEAPQNEAGAPGPGSFSEKQA